MKQLMIKYDMTEEQVLVALSRISIRSGLTVREVFNILEGV